MASQSLYRKWRSQTFSDLVGQEPVVRTLKNALGSGNLSHAYLFTGPRGTGKTSTARLLAKTLNCTNRKNGEPCNECEQCREITAGNSFNVIEIDAASNRGIDSIRELREKVMVRPTTGRYKIYILDEAHMLTVEAFNALLKTLEEPPEHVIFVMATTDVHKMLPTVLSRCQRFDFKRITARQIVAHLQFVAGQEHVKLEQGAAELIARAAAGGMRDALSLLDQAIAYSGQEISLTQVQTMLGVADPRAIQKFITCIAQLDGAAGLHLIHELAEAGADLRQINSQVAEYWRAMMLAKAGANIAEILDSTEDEIHDIVQTAQLFKLEELTECARIFAQNDLMQKNQGTPQLGLELALLTSIGHHRHAQSSQVGQSTAPTITHAAPPIHPAHAPRPAPVQEQPHLTVVPRSQTAQSGDTTVSQTTIEKQSFLPIASEGTSESLPDWDEVPLYGDDEVDEEPETSPTPPISLVSAVSPVQEKAEELISAMPISASSLQEPGNEPSLAVAQIKEKWENVKKRVKTRRDNVKEGSIVAPLLNDFSVVVVDSTAERAVVTIQATHEWHYKAMGEKERYKLVEWALKMELGRECRVRLLAPNQTVPLPSPSASSLLNSTSNHSADIVMPIAPQQSAHREQPTPDSSTRSTPPEQAVQEPPEQQEPTNTSVSSSSTSTSNISGGPPPLARTHVVRENTTSKASVDTTVPEPSSETRREVLEKKAKTDPVVREVVRMFKANIKDIHPK